MTETSKVEVLQIALRDAEKELCAVQQEFVDQGSESETLDLTLEVVRIALYGNNSASNVSEEFASVHTRLDAIRAEAIRYARIIRRSEAAARRLMRAKDEKEKLAATGWSILWLMATGFRPSLPSD